MSSPSAKIVADSVSPEGVRLTTMEVVIHRFVLAEFNTHRVFSRNSASSRAIPVRKQMRAVKEDLALPVSWPAEQKGMQGGAELDDDDEYQRRSQAMSNWDRASRLSLEAAGSLVDLGLHKSLVNRLLEPFMWHTVIVTATAWSNFFDLRLDRDAQPEIRQAAEAMADAMAKSQPTELLDGEWHLPYVTFDDEQQVGLGISDATDINAIATLKAVSAARCARVSYLTHDGRRDMLADIDLYDRLVTERLSRGLAIHWSPLEHVATPWAENRQPYSPDLTYSTLTGQVVKVANQHLPRVGNLLGWRSMRTEVEAQQGARTFS